MRVGLITDTASQCLGINRYAQELVAGLLEMGLVDQLVVVQSQKKAPVDLDHLRTSPNATPKQVQVPNLPFAQEMRQLFLLPAALRDCDLDVVHDLYQFAPFLLDRNPYARCVTVQDVHLWFPEFISELPRSRRLLFLFRYRVILPMLLRRAHRILVPSTHTKNDLVNRLGVHADSIAVVHYGVSKVFQQAPRKQCVESVRLRYSLGNDYVLGVISSNPVDNVSTLLRAFKMARRWQPNDSLKLALFGGVSPGTQNLIREMGLTSQVILTGHVPDQDLACLYAAAEMFVYPSLYEGFGLPVVEAMACGCPVVASDASCMREITGGAAGLASPLDAEGFGRIMLQIRSDEDLRRDMIERGHHNVQRFSWTKTARETAKIYRELTETC